MAAQEYLKHPRFKGLFWTQFLGALNDNMFKNSLVILVLYGGWTWRGLPTEKLAMAAAAIFILPFFVFSAVAGEIADSCEKSLLIRRLKTGEVCIALVAVAGLLTGSVPLLFLVLFALAAQSAFFGPVKYSILPQLLDDEELVGGNALVETATSLAILLGTIAGGVLAAHSPKLVALAVLLLAVCGWFAAQRIPAAHSVNLDLKPDWSLWRPSLSCLRMATEKRAVFLSILGISWFWLFGGAFMTLLPLYSKDFLLAQEAVTTLLLAGFSVGVAVGSLICERVSGGRLELGLVPIGSLGMSVFAFDLGLVRALPEAVEPRSVMQFLELAQGPRILLDMAGLAVFCGLYVVPLFTLVQKRTDEARRSRVIAGNSIINALFMVVSTAGLMALMSHGWTIPGLFTLLAIANALVAIYIYQLVPEFFLRLVALVICRICYSLRGEGVDKVPEEGAALLVCNHVTLVDWLFLVTEVRRPIRFVMWHTYAEMPVARFLFRGAGVIPIASSKTHPEILEKAMASVHEALANGEVVLIFPEGRLTRDGELGVFRKGVERILEKSPVPVIVMALRNLWGTRWSCAPHRRFHWRPRIELVTGRVHPPAEVTAERLRQEILTLL